MSFLKPIDIAEANALRRGTLIEHLGIVVTEAGDDWLRATMPVDARTRQPFGLLHGGASVVLAETLGSRPAATASIRPPMAWSGWKSTPTTCARCAKAR